MTKEFSLAEGYQIDNLHDLHECFHVNDTNILANISSNNLYKVTNTIIRMLDEPVFFFLEVPCTPEEEQEINNDNDCLHKNVYYIDNCNTKVIVAILKRYGEILFNDGHIKFGFASHKTEDEIYFLNYNILSIYSENINSYSKELSKFDIIEENDITTICDYISDDNPATCVSIDVNGENVYDIIENLKEVGMYLSHTDIDN